MIIRQSNTRQTCALLKVARIDEWAIDAEVAGVNEKGETVTYNITLSTNEIARLLNAVSKAA